MATKAQPKPIRCIATDYRERASYQLPSCIVETPNGVVTVLAGRDRLIVAAGGSLDRTDGLGIAVMGVPYHMDARLRVTEDGLLFLGVNDYEQQQYFWLSRRDIHFGEASRYARTTARPIALAAAQCAIDTFPRLMHEGAMADWESDMLRARRRLEEARQASKQALTEFRTVIKNRPEEQR